MTDYKNLKLIATSSPHIRAAETTRSIMLDVIIAMVPALVWAIVKFGFKALTLTAVSVIGCLFFEWGYRKIMKKPQSVGDLSAVVTGILLAFVCPVTLPYWTILIGDFFAIVVVKQLFGGIGKNFINPALAGRAALLAGYASFMTTWIDPGGHEAGITGQQSGTARQSGVDEVLADAAEQLLDHHDGEEVADENGPVGQRHRAHKRQQDAGDHGGQVAHGLGLLHDLAVTPLEEQAADDGHGGQRQGLEAELHNGPDQGGHHGDDDIQHDGAGVLRRPDVGGRSRNELQILVIRHLLTASFFSSAAAFFASAAALSAAILSLSSCLPVLNIWVRCIRAGQM